MPFTNIGKDKYISQELSKLTSCNAPDLSSKFDQAEYWVRNFILNSIFRVSIREEDKPLIFGILRRSQMSLLEYEEGRIQLLDYISGPENRISVYFLALYRFELVVMLLYQSYEMISKSTQNQLFTQKDGSPLQRLNRIYNVTKHLELRSIPEGHIHSMWITNDGVNTGPASLTWEELSTLILEIGSIADSISNLTPRNKTDGT